MEFTCDCVKKFKKHLEKSYKKEGSIDFDIKGPFGKIMEVTSNLRSRYAVEVEISQREIKKDGKPYKNRTKDTCSITINYCPFCKADIIDE